MKKNNTISFLTDQLEFPNVDNANSEGLLAIGGDLSSERLLKAYKNGIFPWYNEESIIMWWSPDPRMVLFPNKIRISKSMRKICSSNRFRLTKNSQFEEVMEQCAQIKRRGQAGTWITTAMKEAYLRLHREGVAQSYEVWLQDRLVGGLYGLDLGHVFCGESMYSKVDNASKFAFIELARQLHKKKYKLIDCQMYTQHLESLGAVEIPRKEFIKILRN